MTQAELHQLFRLGQEGNIYCSFFDGFKLHLIYKWYRNNFSLTPLEIITHPILEKQLTFFDEYIFGKYFSKLLCQCCPRPGATFWQLVLNTSSCVFIIRLIPDMSATPLPTPS